MSSGSEDDVKSGYFLKDVVDFLGENSENNFPKIFIPDFSRNNETKCYELVRAKGYFPCLV
jgi:hypothetical protein